MVSQLWGKLVVPQFPYLIRGVVQKNGVDQVGVDVAIKNVTKSEEHTRKTDSNGKYWVDLGDSTKYTSGYSDNDSITVTVVALDIQKSTTVDIAILAGRVININLIIVELTETVEGTPNIATTKIFMLAESTDLFYSIGKMNPLAIYDRSKGLDVSMFDGLIHKMLENHATAR